MRHGNTVEFTHVALGLVPDILTAIDVIVAVCEEFRMIDAEVREVSGGRSWRYNYNNVQPHSSLGNQTPAEARRALEQFEGSTHDALAQTDNEKYEIQTRKLSL